MNDQAEPGVPAVRPGQGGDEHESERTLSVRERASGGDNADMDGPTGRRIGVDVCHCGGNISDYVDVEKVIEDIRDHARRAPDHPAIILAEADGTHTTHSYAQLVAAMDRHAAAFRAAGLAPGDRCGLLARQGPGFRNRQA